MAEEIHLPVGIEVIVGAILQDPDGRILLIRQHKWNDQFSCFVGGHVKPGEMLIDALRREIREEVGLEMYDPVSIGIEESINSSYYERPAHLIFINYVGHTIDTHYRLQDKGEIQEARWEFPLNALNMVLDNNRSTIEQLLASGKLGIPPEKRR